MTTFKKNSFCNNCGKIGHLFHQCKIPITSIGIIALRKIQDNYGMSILIISHNLNVIRHITDDLAVMYFGKIMEKGSTVKIFKSPKHPYTKALTSLIKKIDLDHKFKKIELKGEVPSIFERKSGCVFSSRCQNPSHDCKNGNIENKLIKYDEDHWVDQCCIGCN